MLNNGAAFTAFANAVLGPSPPPAQQAALKAAVQAWFLRFDTLIERALPAQPWGPGRLDAVAMIFNRLTGLDLGPPPSYLIPGNIQQAVAPVRYPFLWNAAIQDHTQWPGFAEQRQRDPGSRRAISARSTACSVPSRRRRPGTGSTIWRSTRPTSRACSRWRSLIKKIGPPQWPWTVNNTLADQGEAIFNRPTANGGCVDCHGIKPGITRPIGQKTWATPVLDVGTDTREYDILGWTAQSGVMNGAYTAADSTPIKPVNSAIDILGMAVAGSIEQYCLENPVTCLVDGSALGLPQRPKVGGLKGMFKVSGDGRRLRGRGSCRASGRQHPTCTTARCRRWRSC